jgi:hypothetical protein
MNATDLRILVLILFVVWLVMLWKLAEAKQILGLLLLLCPGFILMLAVLHFTWGPVIGDWLKSFD